MLRVTPMTRPPIRRARRLLTASAALLLMGAAVLHCSTGAVGIEACRDIETKKCEVAVDCPGVDISEESDVNECKLFYHDQCMFGIADAEADPDGILVEACIAAIDQAAGCKGAETIADCENAPALASSVNSDATACELILFPQRLADCNFLAAPGEGSGGTGTGSEGGAGGTGGAAGGSGGAGGASSGGLTTGGNNAGGSGGA
jgi:hypothetical protein